jgi:uncharacterized protein
MVIVDANILLYAYNSDSAFHKPAKDWLEANLAGVQPFGIPWVTILAFLRIGTNPRAFNYPFNLTDAVSIVQEWLEHPLVSIPQPGERHWGILSKLLITAQANGPLVSDAYLAALAIEHGATLFTTDSDFSRFKDLKFINPLTDCI